MTRKKRYHRASPFALEKRKRQIREFLERGVPVAEMAQRLQVSTGVIYGMIRKTPDMQLNRSPRGMAHRVGMLGRMGHALAPESDEFRDWLRANVPEGSTVAEFLVSIAVDVFQEESDAAIAA